MTHQEIIDNIQTRIENIIAQRLPDTFNVTTLSVSEYNPEIDSTVTVTVTMEDQNGDPITGQTVPLYIDNNSVSGLTTDSNGQCTYNYTCEDWGTHTFEVNGKTIQITVQGWKTINTYSNTLLERNGNTRTIRITFAGQTISSIGTTWTNYGTGDFVTEPPKQPVVTLINDATAFISITNNGVIAFKSNTGSTLTNKRVYVQIDWTY